MIFRVFVLFLNRFVIFEQVYLPEVWACCCEDVYGCCYSVVNVFHFCGRFSSPCCLDGLLLLLLRSGRLFSAFAVGYWSLFFFFIPVAAIISITVSIVAVSAVLVLRLRSKQVRLSCSSRSTGFLGCDVSLPTGSPV